MAYVVTEKCVNCVHSHCVDVCPVECFHKGPNWLVIDPDECIDCGLCVLECPEEAIESEEDLGDSKQLLMELNYKYSKSWPVITESQATNFDTEYWKNIPNRIDLIKDYD